MRNFFFSLLAAASFSAGTIQAVEPTPGATDRAALYQREVRSVLTKHLWRVTQDSAGTLTAERLRIQSGPVGIVGGDNTFARLTINFQADSKHHTAAAARASLLVYQPRESSEVGRLIYPPLALRDPQLTREYRDILAAAESQLAAGHPALAAAKGHGPETTGDPGRVAMK